ncbi:quinol:cytochrome C oxidoreductase [Pseudoflavitalea sp. G-6-1-2]|uniref:quinol:cytochrome C oxidoreductase n=1 Tax=Pseudoflavitalea sp. G-6-1-2 TaxID=2728841 RepID=UPI00146D5FBB|nr:quinol:cytochrome C oxidoreductase [Pseudoflavitalea sp. G-6-1-2]NML19861.1 quinol:cytochrome C oxidoreductase [Pseudoflavitalea sp. G-6-1-2]
MASKEFFEIPKRYRTWSLALMGIGVLSVIIGFLLYGTGEHTNRFWAALLQNSVYFLLVVNASMFFMCATTLAWGSWQLSFGRVTQAISTAVIPIGIITVIILICLVTIPDVHIYHWLHPHGDKILEGKSGFLNKSFFIIWTLLTLIGWIVLGAKMRKLNLELENNPPSSTESARKYLFKNTVWAAVFIVWFALTVMSTVPWLWLMSIDAHWYSTMYSWYTFASTFVAGMAVIVLFVVYLKNQGYLEYTNEEHMHDLGKFMFAFSIFWTYLWFSQYMLIWYANIPEETVYFRSRITTDHESGAYTGVFWFSFVINFLAPFLILMRRGSKRNYTTIAMMAIVILVGHWFDFYQMVFASVEKDHVPLNLFDFGVAAGFVGLIIFSVGRALSKTPLIAKNHPLIKESIIHHT